MRRFVTEQMAIAIVSLVAFLAFAGKAMADVDIGTTDVSDGVLDASDWPAGQNTLTIDLGLAVAKDWDQPSAGNGVYDANKWAVVFKYSSVNIPAGKFLKFKNHPSGAPVVWLVQGPVAIAGQVDLRGANQTGVLRAPSEPGPGGFRGGAGWSAGNLPGAGMGPGGGNPAAGGSFGSAGSNGPSATYGNAECIPLIGGSGGGAHPTSGDCGGGAGGGAILVATRGTLTLTLADGNSAIVCNGGSGCGGSGSGGAIRLVADSITGSAALMLAQGGGTGWYGGLGRIRVDSNSNTLSGDSSPSYTQSLVGPTAVIWPPATAPSVRVASIGGQSVPLDPNAELTFPNSDVVVNSTTPLEFVVLGTNVPLDWTVTVRVVPKSGTAQVLNAVLQPGSTEASSTWKVSATVGNAFSAVQARAKKP